MPYRTTPCLPAAKVAPVTSGKRQRMGTTEMRILEGELGQIAHLAAQSETGCLDEVLRHLNAERATRFGASDLQLAAIWHSNNYDRLRRIGWDWRIDRLFMAIDQCDDRLLPRAAALRSVQPQIIDGADHRLGQIVPIKRHVAGAFDLAFAGIALAIDDHRLKRRGDPSTLALLADHPLLLAYDSRQHRVACQIRHVFIEPVSDVDGKRFGHYAPRAARVQPINVGPS